METIILNILSSLSDQFSWLQPKHSKEPKIRNKMKGEKIKGLLEYEFSINSLLCYFPFPSHQ
jgi:hypothetical protein